MYNDSSYADVLESYTIAEEGIMDKIKGKINERKRITNAKDKYKELYEKYNLSNSKARKQFVSDLIKDIDINIKKIVTEVNHDKKYFDEVRKNVLKYFSGDENSCRNLLADLKPGYFTANCVDNDCWVIIPDQIIAKCCDLPCRIVDVLKSNPDPRYTFVSFGTGHAEEGCVRIYIKLY